MPRFYRVIFLLYCQSSLVIINQYTSSLNSLDPCSKNIIYARDSETLAEESCGRINYLLFQMAGEVESEN